MKGKKKEVFDKVGTDAPKMKRVKFNPKTHQVVSHEQVAAQRDHYLTLGEERGHARGYAKGAHDVKLAAYADLADVWLEASKHLQTASNYAATLSEMYKPAQVQDTAKAKENPWELVNK